MKVRDILVWAFLLVISCGKTSEENIVQVTSVQLNQTSIEIKVGETFTLIANVKPSDATNKQVVWSCSNPAVASVNGGVVKAISSGLAVITAKAGSISSTCTVSVIQPVSKISLNYQRVELIVGEQVLLEAIVEPSNASDKNIEWSSEKTSVATVEDGLVKAVSEGVTKIFAKSGDVISSCEVTVQPYVPVSNLRLNVETLSLEKDSEYQFTATVEPENASYKNITWRSSDDSVVSVGQDGLIKAVAVGNATIYAKADAIEASCAVHVVISVQDIVLNKESLSLVEGQTEQLYASIIPQNATDQLIYWSSSDEKIANVSETGVVEAVSEGSAIITAKIGVIERVCTVNVSRQPIPVTSIRLNKEWLDLNIGEKETIIVIKEPENATEEVAIKWSSSKSEIASVDEFGCITACQEGYAYITADSRFGAMRVQVSVHPYAESVEVIPVSPILKAGQTLELTAYVNPSNALQDVIWTSLDETIIKVIETRTNDGHHSVCLIKALKEGKGCVEVKTLNNKSSQVEIIVSNDIDGAANEGIGSEIWD